MPAKPPSPFADPAFKQNPYPLYARLRADGPVHRATLPNGVAVYVVTRYADVQAALKDDRLVKNIRNARSGVRARVQSRVSNSNMLRADPPAHTRLRALAHEAFTPRFVGQMRGHVQEIADRLIDAALPRGRMDFIGDFAFPLPITVICEMLGVPAADESRFRAWSTALVASGALSSESPHLLPEMVQLTAYLARLIRQRRRAPQDDLISQLIRAEQAGDHLSPPELLSTTTVLLIAGHETTVNLIGSGMLALLQNPAQKAALQQNPALIKGAVEELVRYVSPVQVVNRYAAQDLQIGGVDIPRGSHVTLSLASGNHDAAYTADPETLDVTHSDAKHVAFGQGIHYCLGAPLARLEGEIAFTTVLRRLPDIRLDADPAALKWRPSFELRGLSRLPVAF